MTVFFLNPSRLTWLDRLPAPRMPRLRKRGQRHADALTPPHAPDPGWTGPRHASTGRLNCGGLPRAGGPMPRRQPGETRFGSLIDRGPDRAPWLTGEMAVLAGECRVPEQTDADTLRMYRGDWGTMPQLEAARLTEAILP